MLDLPQGHHNSRVTSRILRAQHEVAVTTAISLRGYRAKSTKGQLGSGIMGSAMQEGPLHRVTVISVERAFNREVTVDPGPRASTGN